MARAECASCGARIRAKDRFCPSCGTPIAAAQAAPPATQQSASLQVPVASARALAEQRKVVTILFADLSGSTPLAEKLDPEDLRSILGRYFNALARQIQRYEGTIDKYIGDAIMAIFGAPISHEDDAERAIRSALAMQASIQRLNDDLEREHGVRLALRIGVNTGEVVAGMLGGDAQQSYTVVGDAVNTAQRFESVAPLNEILVSETTRRLAIHSFEFETLPPVTLKGKAQPVAAYRVLRPRDEEIPPEASPLIGRTAELERLREALGDALVGNGRAMAIVGEAGVGKSRLVAEFKAGLAGGIERLTGRCASYETNTPFALLASIIRAAFRIDHTSDEPTARVKLREGFARFGDTLDDGSLTLLLDVLGYGERSTLEAERKRSVLTGILRAFLDRAGERSTFVIAAEDLHWADLASVAVLAELVRDVRTLPFLFISTARPGWEPPWEAEILELAPLDATESRTLIEEILEHAATDEAVGIILERTAGNPFFIEELVRATRENGQAELPQSVQEVVEARIERLAEGPSRALQTAAVIGVTFWYRVLERLMAGEGLAAHIAELEQEAYIITRSVRPELTYGFRQSLLREVAYQTQLLSTRRLTHQAVAVAIEEIFGDRLDEFVDLLAYHYERSDDVPSALRWLVRAGDRARALYANDEALTSYRAALRRAVDGTGPLDAATILERIADVETLVGRYEAAIASYEQARGRLGQAAPVVEARLWRKTGAAKQLHADYDGARSAVATARATLADVDDAERARVEILAGQIAWRLGDYETARAALSEAISVGERLGADDVLAEGLKQLGNVSFLASRSQDALASYHRSLGIYQRMSDVAGLANVHSNLGVVHRRLGEWDDALRELGESLRLRERMGDPWGIGTIHNNIGEVHRTRGELDEAAAAYERAIAIWTPIGYRSGVALALTGLGAAQVERGEAARGLETLRDAEVRWAALGSRTYLPDLYRFLASAHLALGDLAEADSAIERSLELARAANARHQIAMGERVCAEIASVRGDPTRAAELLEASRGTLRELGEWAELARTEAAIARLDF